MVCLLSVNCAGRGVKMPVQLYLCGCWLDLAGGGRGWFHSCAAAASERGAHTKPNTWLLVWLRGVVPGGASSSSYLSVRRRSAGQGVIPLCRRLCGQGCQGHRLRHPAVLIPCNPECDGVPELSATKQIRAGVTCQSVAAEKDHSEMN